MSYKFRVIVALIALCFFLINTSSLSAQNCSNDSTGLIPITDLTTGDYKGFQGGLYFGSNTKPVQQVNNLNSAISKIRPINAFGETDSANGRIVLLAIGASNPKTEFQSFQEIADTFSLINPYLTIVNGCKGGSGIQKIVHASDSYWSYVDYQLDYNNVYADQVQVIWLEEDNTSSNNFDFPSAPNELMEEYKKLFGLLLKTFPNLQVCYLSGRGYAGYMDTHDPAGPGLRQPRDYYHGWAIKWLIENQIKGDESLSFSDLNKKAPVLDWSAYLWTDGNNQRSDGLFWECPGDIQWNDGLHWSEEGNDKAGKKIFDKFYFDNESRLWFFKQSTFSAIEQPGKADITIYPNPVQDHFYVNTGDGQPFDLSIYSTAGSLVFDQKNLLQHEMIQPQLTPGFYLVRIQTADAKTHTAKLIIGH